MIFYATHVMQKWRTTSLSQYHHQNHLTDISTNYKCRVTDIRNWKTNSVNVRRSGTDNTTNKANIVLALYISSRLPTPLH